MTSFAKRVLETAKRVDERYWVGTRKVFIHAVWTLGFFGEMDLATFKAKLVAENQARNLSLSRADLVEAMPERWVRWSETFQFGAELHFVTLD